MRPISSAGEGPQEQVAPALAVVGEHMTTSSFPAALAFLLAGFGEPRVSP